MNALRALRTDGRDPAHRERDPVREGRGPERQVPDPRAARARGDAAPHRDRPRRRRPRSPTSVRALAARFDNVFTSGGVGPTHDDVTLTAVGDGVRHAARSATPSSKGCCAASYGERLHDRDLRMADLPAGARLEYGPGGPGTPGRWWWSATSGSSRACRRSSAASSRRCASCSAPARSTAARVYSRVGEGPIAGALDEVVAAFPGVEVGSYPHLDAVDYRVKITLDGRDAAAVDAATARLATLLADAVVRTE